MEEINQNVLISFKDELRRRSDELQRKIGVRDSFVSRKDELLEQEEEIREQVSLISQSLSFVELSVRSSRQEILRNIETIVNEALKTVYVDNSPKIEFEVSVKRERSAIVPYFTKQLKSGDELRREPEGYGCGVSDIASVIMKMILIKASGSEPVLVIDEPFKFLGELQIPNASALLSVLSHKLKVQTIMTTHDKDTISSADKVFDVVLDGDDAVVDS